MRRRLQGPSSVIDCLIKAFEAELCLRSSEAAQGTSNLTGPASHCRLCLSFPKSSFFFTYFVFLSRTCFPPSCLLFLSLSLCLQVIPVIQVAWVTAEGPGQSLKTPPHLPVQLQCSSPCSFYRSWSSWFSCTSPTCRNDPLCQAQAGGSPSGPGQGGRGWEQGPDGAWLMSLSIILMASVFNILTVSIFFTVINNYQHLSYKLRVYA